METRRGLPHDPADTHTRYIEAAIGGVVVGCLYLPSGNPAPGPKFAFARDAGLRIDHLLLSPGIAGRLVAAKVDRDVRGRERTSDHAPVWIQLAEAKSRSSRRAGASAAPE